MKSIVPLLALLVAAPLHAADNTDFDPDTVSEVDAINCHLDAPTYNGFALSVDEDGGIAAKRHWREIKTDNPFLIEYELPEPITVTGTYQTRRIAFMARGILAILDLADPAVLAREEDIVNEANTDLLIEELVAAGKATRAEIEAEIKFRKFLGRRVMVDVTEPAAAGESFGTHTVITRSISNVTTHPGKTLYGCSYDVELVDKDGKPL